MSGPVRARLADGRLHLQHGPIDLIVDARGDAAEVEAAQEQCWQRFADVLDTLVTELPLLRSPLGAAVPLARGPVARRMVAATWPHRAAWITPMAAVAGAVADEMLAALLAGRTLERACVNDGGDIAFFVSGPAVWEVGVVDDPRLARVAARLRIDSRSPARGVATSGWRGRSHSFGIADAVTVLADTAAAADAAATLIANAVDAVHPAIERRPARALQPDSDLGERLVTVAVGPLPADVAAVALGSGLACARSMQARGLIREACLALQDQFRTTHLAAADDALRFSPHVPERRLR